MKKIIPALFACLVALTSCEDTLDVTPKDTTTEDNYFKTATELQMFSDPLYNNLLEKEPFNEQSDQLVCQTLSTILQGGVRRTVPASGGGWSWGNLNGRINTLLDRIDRCPDQAAVEKYTAVARFFRAFFYSEKVKRFGDVPWYEHELGSADAGLYKARNTREYVASKMLEDLEYAITYLPDKKDEKNAPFRLTKGAALALKAQFCLYEGTFRKYHNITCQPDPEDPSRPVNDYKFYLEEAAKAAKALIDRKEYKLYSTNKPNKDYQDLFVKDVADPDEYILAISFQAAIGDNWHNSNAFTLVATQGMPGFTRKFICSYLMKDGSLFTEKSGWQTMQFSDEIKDRDPRLQQTIRGHNYTRIGQSEILPADLNLSVTGYQPIKFVEDPTANGSQTDRNGRSICDMPVYRYAEVLLNYAEALAELGTLTQSDLDISVNLIRQRAGMPDLDKDYANAHPDNNYLLSDAYGYKTLKTRGEANMGVIAEIRRERTIELAMEKFRLHDLNRWAEGHCLDQELTGMFIPGVGEYDFTGDGKPETAVYAKGGKAPAGYTTYAFELNNKIFLTTADNSHTISDAGYLDWHRGTNQVRYGFNEKRDYLFPIPSDELALNQKLVQNPGWSASDK